MRYRPSDPVTGRLSPAERDRICELADAGLSAPQSAFRFNRRHYPFNSFRSLLGLSAINEAPTYASLYSGDWDHPTASGHG